MTNEQARTIADAAVTLKDATTELHTFEERGNTQQAREARRAVAQAQSALDEAIESARKA